jgi:hypothetical protein
VLAGREYDRVAIINFATGTQVPPTVDVIGPPPYLHSGPIFLTAEANEVDKGSVTWYLRIVVHAAFQVIYCRFPIHDMFTALVGNFQHVLETVFARINGYWQIAVNS